tara:strand:+ start:946 stop:1194 length:249 start_codon:yes stop_codon:yes gene_type:complete
MTTTAAATATATATATAKRIEYRITRELLQRREGPVEQEHITPWADRLIAIGAVTVGLLVLGAYVEELLWAAVAAATVFTLR